MVHAHLLDSWTVEADRHRRAYYTLQWIGGVASPLFLFLAGCAMAMSAGSKARQAGSVVVGARAARARGWEIFVLALLFRVQAELLGFGPLATLLKVDMLNIMGVSIVVASLIWQQVADRKRRVIVFALITAAITLSAPIVRSVPWLGPLPDPLEAYLRPAGDYAAFPMFPWTGYLFAGVLTGDLIDGRRLAARSPALLQLSLVLFGALGIGLGLNLSYRPALYPTADFWHDSPTIFFIRLGAVAMLVPIAWTIEQLSSRAGLLQRPFGAMVTLGRSSLFVYWIHIEMIYGVIAEPLKKDLPLWATQVAWALLCVALYRIVLAKNSLLHDYELPRRARIFAAVLR